MILLFKNGLPVYFLFVFSMVPASYAKITFKTASKANLLEEAPANDTERNQYYRKKLKKDWLIPMPKGEYERLSRRFKGLSMFDADDRPWVVPGVTLVSPTGFSAKWGDIFGGFGVTNRGRYTNNPDGVVVVGAGFGDPVSWLGFEVSLTFLNVKKFFRSGLGISAKMSHTFADTTSIAIGAYDFLQFPPNASDTGNSTYLSVSRTWQLKNNPSEAFSLLVGTLGLGNGQFKTDEQLLNDIEAIGIFSSLSLRIVPPLNMIVNWDQNLHLGFSVSPFRRFPLIFTAGGLDFLDRNASQGVRLLFGISYSDSVFSQTFPVGWFRGNRI